MATAMEIITQKDVNVDELLFPPDWQNDPRYLRIRINRLWRALPFCRGRAKDVRVKVEKEIKRLTVREAVFKWAIDRKNSLP